MEQVRARVVAHRVRSPLGVDDRLDRLTDLETTAQGAAMDDEAADRSLRVLDREEVAATAGLPDRALVADLPAAFGVEGCPVEDDLGLAVPRELAEFHPVSDDRHDPALGGRRFVAEELGVADAALDRAIERREFGVLRQFRLLARSTPFALFG